MHTVIRWLGRLLPLVFFALSLGGGTIAETANLNALLRGDYAFSQAMECVDTTEGFGSNYDLSPLPPAGTPGVHFIRKVAISIVGVAHFNGDGTGTASFTGTFININSVLVPVSASELTADFTYSVNPDGTVDIQAAVSGTEVAGAGAGNVFAITGIMVRRLIADKGATLLHGPHHPPTIETVAVTQPDATSFTFDRVCTRSGISRKIR